MATWCPAPKSASSKSPATVRSRSPTPCRCAALLDALQVPDEVCAHFKDLGDDDCRPAREVAEGDQNTEVRSVIDVDILGHIFEQSITDLERLRESLSALSASGRGRLVPDSQRENSETQRRAVPAPMQTEAAMPAVPVREIGRRRRQEGAVYTPAFITRYLVEQALGGVLKTRFDTLRRQHESEAAGTSRKTLADPNALASAS